jgi:ABC-2 type transport system ATP-binding protein
MLSVETEGLTKSYGRKTVLHDLELRVPTGCVYGFVGPNGAGKTTAMRLLLGLLRPDRGRVRIMGHELPRHRLAALAGVGALIESPSLYDHLSGRNNLEITRILLNLPGSETDRVLEIVDLRSAADQRVAGYSLGMKQRLALGRALMGSPRLLLLDEPTNGLDPSGILSMRALIRSLPDRMGGTVFLSSHLLNEVEQVANMVGFMNRGRLVLQDSVRSLLGSDRILRIETDDGERAADLLERRGAELIDRSGGTLRLRYSNPDAMRRDAACANRALIEAGMDVHSISFEARTLEHVYRDAVQAGGHGISDEGAAA